MDCRWRSGCSCWPSTSIILFDRHYSLIGNEKDAIRKALGDRVLGFFESNPGWGVETHGRWIVIYRVDELSPLTGIESFLRSRREIAAMFEA